MPTGIGMPTNPASLLPAPRNCNKRSPLRSGMTGAGVSITPNELMARITAERLVRHLERSGFVVLKPLTGCPIRLIGTVTRI